MSTPNGTNNHRDHQNDFTAAKAHFIYEVEQARIQARRVACARVTMEAARLAWARDYPTGVGLDAARAVTWKCWSYTPGGLGWNPDVGQRVNAILDELPEVVRILGEPICVAINGVEISCFPGDAAGKVLDAYWGAISTREKRPSTAP